jgi:hypothetical protein
VCFCPCVALRCCCFIVLCWRWRPPRRPRRWRPRGATAPPSAPGTASTTPRSISTLLLRLPPAPTPPPLPLKPIAIAAVAAAATSIAAAPVVTTSDAVAAPPSGSTAGASQLFLPTFSLSLTFLSLHSLPLAGHQLWHSLLLTSACVSKLTSVACGRGQASVFWKLCRKYGLC